MLMKRILLSIAALAMAAGIAHAINITGTNSENQKAIFRVGYIRLSSTDNITAFAGGGQTSAVQLESALNRIATVATGNDSVKLPSCQSGRSNTGQGTTAIPTGDSVGIMLWVVNAAAANSLNVFPQTGQSINALSANSAYAVAANKAVIFACGTNGIWYTNLTA